MVNEWDVPLFEVPDKYQPPKRQRKLPVWSDYHGRRTSCDDCIMALARGEARFLAERATHMRLGAEGTAYYCARHAHARKIQER